jgi:hypothetical protein
MESDKKGLYIETTIPSYATGRTSADLITAGKQALTKLFWEQERHKYELFTSIHTFNECKKGDREAAQKRIAFLEGIQVLPESAEIDHLAAIYQHLLKIPEKAKTDSFHLASCVLAGIDYLLTWNFTHLGVFAYPKVKAYNDRCGLRTPLLMTPEALTKTTEE